MLMILSIKREDKGLLRSIYSVKKDIDQVKTLMKKRKHLMKEDKKLLKPKKILTGEMEWKKIKMKTLNKVS